MPQSEYWPFPRSKEVDKGNNAEPSILQKQLGAMEGEVKEMQMELEAIKQDRMFSRLQSRGFEELDGVVKDTVSFTEPVNVFQQDELGNVTEIEKLREELVKARNAAEDERFHRKQCEGKLHDLELKLKTICGTTDGTCNFTEQEFMSLKTQYRIIKEELDDVKIILAEKADEAQEYHNLYLQTQQEVEELKRDLTVAESDSQQVAENINLEIQKVKMQFQEKLQELSPLPNLLNGALAQLSDSQEHRKLAESQAQQYLMEINEMKQALKTTVDNLSEERTEKIKLTQENELLSAKIGELTKAIENRDEDLKEFSYKITHLEEKIKHDDKEYQIKKAECEKLKKELDDVLVEQNRSINRIQARSAALRRHSQRQIAGLERMLISSRAQTKILAKRNNEIRTQFNNRLNGIQNDCENAEACFRGLKAQTEVLKIYIGKLINNNVNQ